MHIFIYPFILYRLFYFISFYSILFYLLSFIDDQNFFIAFFFHLFCDNLPCSGMFRDVPECSGMFRDVPECSMFRVLLTPRRKSPRTSKRTKTNAADERAGAVIESLTSDVDVKGKILEEMTLAG